MILAKLSCPKKWTLEYTGFLMSNPGIGHHRTSFECVDKSLELVKGESINQNNGGVFYNVEATCNGLKCPPYHNHREVMCVVCTR